MNTKNLNRKQNKCPNTLSEICNDWVGVQEEEVSWSGSGSSRMDFSTAKSEHHAQKSKMRICKIIKKKQKLKNYHVAMFYPCHAYEYLSLALLYNYSLSINLIRFLNFSSAYFLFPMLSAFLFSVLIFFLWLSLPMLSSILSFRFTFCLSLSLSYWIFYRLI